MKNEAVGTRPAPGAPELGTRLTVKALVSYINTQHKTVTLKSVSKGVVVFRYAAGR